MGASHIRDENVQIYMELTKQLFMSGDWVQGQVFLRVLKPSPYTKLVIGVEGEQYVYWSQGSGNNRRVYSNRYKSYNSFFVVSDFQGGMQQGDYIFPFAFLLPSMITGSFFQSKNCFLKYTIKTELIHISEAKRNQFYEMFLNVIQPPRGKIGPSSVTTIVHSKCCGCCADYGMISVTLNCDKNFAMNGDAIQVNGCVDNTRGKKIIENYVAVLERRVCKISSRGRVQDNVQQAFEFYRSGPIQPNNTQNFNFLGKIPDNLTQCTAIGKIVSLYYILHIYTNYGCCANKEDAKIHLVIHSRTPMIVKPVIMPPPQSWSPTYLPLLTYQNMSPYLYIPVPKIPFLNQILAPMMIENSGGFNQISNNNNISMEESGNRMVEETSWNSNQGYKPVFYDEEMMSDAQRSYNNSKAQQRQNPIFRKL